MPTTQTLCYNCFAQRGDPSGPCPYCGFDLEENRQKFPVALRAGTVLNDRYIVGRVLGQGGFGITYVAFDTQLQARVAVKEYIPSDMATRVEGTTVSVMMDTRAEDFTYGAERFQEEARTLAKFIGHPNIAGVSSYFDQNDTSYFVMDYIEGVSFKSYIANAGGKVSVDETLNVMIPVLRALTAVHGEGFIHRDVTPDNIYISKDGNVKLLDFGSARYSIGDKSKSLDVILKVGYAPKEQYTRRGRQGPYTDVYSCAACFYAALTGYLPPESLERLDQDTLVPVSQVLPEIPEWLDKAILKGLAVQPEDRFQSAAEFLDTIENQLVVEVPAAGQAVPAPAKKKPLPLIIGGVAAALAVAIGIGVFVGGRSSQPGGQTPGGAAVSPGAGQGQHQDGGRDQDLLEAEVPYITIRGEQYSTDLRKLELENMGLTNEDIQDLKYMINLTNLRLMGNDITDLSPVAGLTGLRYIDLRENQNLSDFSPLAGLTNLEEINFWNTAIEDYSFMANMSQLTTLEFYNIKEDADLSCLSGLTNVTRVYCNGGDNYINDLSFLSGMTRLTTAWIEMNPYIETIDLSPLAGLTGLTELSIYVNGGNGSRAVVKDLSPLAGMTKMQTLNLSAEVDSLAPLAGMTELRSLQLYSNNGGNSGYNPLTDITALAGMTRLTSLQLHLGEVKDLSPLAGLTELTDLGLYGYEQADFSDLSFLSSMSKLKTLSLSGAYDCTIENFHGMEGLTSLQTLNFTCGSGLRSFEGLENLTELTELMINCQDARFTDTAPLKGLIKLKSLNLPYMNYNTGLYVDLSGLSEMTALTELGLSIPIKSLAPLAGLTSLKTLSIDDRANHDAPNPLDLSPLSNLSSVTELQLYSSRTHSLSGLEGMTSLRTLYVSMGTYDHPLTSIEPLRNLSQLNSVSIYGTIRVSDRSPLDHVASVEMD